jgi:hypothetical protein
MSIDNVISQDIAFSEGHAIQPQDQIYVLSSSELKNIIARAIEEAVEPLQSRIDALETIEQQERDRIHHDIAQDRKRISQLEYKDPQPMQKDRGEILRALIAAHGGKMLAKDARKMMHLIKPRFSELLATMTDIEVKPYHRDRRQLLLIIK